MLLFVSVDFFVGETMFCLEEYVCAVSVIPLCVLCSRPILSLFFAACFSCS